MYVQTKQEILDDIRDGTKDFHPSKMERFSANGIGKRKNISRTLVSQYLNELFKEGLLVKINSRPVYFLHKEVLELQYEIKLSRQIYFSIDEMMEELLQTQFQMLDFGKAIGEFSSLSYCVEQCKAAVSYPPSGLPVLLTGESGTGKSYFARLTYEYAVNNGLIAKNSSFYTLDCSEYAKEPEKLRSVLFGEVRLGEIVPGLLVQAEGSILFFDVAHSLTPECQEQLFTYLDEGRFHRNGEKEKWITSRVRLLFATMKKPEDVFLRTFLRRIPVIVHMPSLSERSWNEKEEFIVRFFKRESKKVGKEIQISRRVLNVLLNHIYPGNVGELDQIIRTACSEAWLNQKKSEGLTVMLYHFPENVLERMKTETETVEEAQNLISLNSYERDTSTDRIATMFDELLDAAVRYASLELPFAEFIEEGMKSIHSYYDYLAFGKRYVHSKVRAVQTVLSELFEGISERYSVILPANCSFVLARSIFAMSQDGFAIEQWEEERKEDLIYTVSFLNREASRESLIASELLRAVQDNLDLRFHRINQIFLTINLVYYNRKIQFNETAGIIISHGYSTASSIADTANKLLGSAVFYAMDMPLEMGTEEIAARLKRHVETHRMYKNIILLVDMGSLEEIGEKLESVEGIHVGIINNVSTQAALETGTQILNQSGIEELLETVCQNVRLTYKIINTQKREPAVLFTSEMGIHAAERMLSLFGTSLSGHGKIQLVLTDFTSLLEKQERHEWFERYKVLCVIGTMNPGLAEVPFFPLDALISGEKGEALGRALTPYLTEKETQALSETLLKNFSLQNVVQNLTILNADTLLEYVIKAVKRLQSLLGKNFTNRTLTGFYVHISCMVERLVTKTLTGDVENKDFIREHPEFVQKTRNAFQEIEGHYRITIPISEIEFLYEYIEYEEKSRKE